jgi:Putative Ig domain
MFIEGGAMKRSALCRLVFGFGLILSCIQIMSCSGKPSTYNSVILAASGPLTIGQGKSITITAQVLNDASNAGVSWALTPPTGEGTFNPAPSTTSATYVALSPITAAYTVTITATSITYPTQSMSYVITVQPPPSIPAVTLPSGSINGAYSGTITAVGGVPPLAWAVIGTLPPGLTLDASTTDTVTISGTPTAEGVYPFTVQVTDATGTTAVSGALSITVGDLAVTTTSPLPAATVNTIYNEQLTASGGTPNYTWALAGTSTLPAGLTLSSTGLISGTPTATQAATSFSVTVTDSSNPPEEITVSLSLTVNAATSGASILSGNYAFEFSGFNSNGAVVVAGSFFADGISAISGGLEDSNTIIGPTQNQTLPQAFTGTFTLGNDNRGQLVFSSLPNSPVYAFSIDPTGSHGRMIEFDTATGIRGSGEIEKQSVTTCASNTINGEYAMGATGYSATEAGSVAGPSALAGAFIAEPPVTQGTPGSIGPGEMDTNTPNTPGGVYPPDPQQLSGTYQTTTNAGVCTMALNAINPLIMTFDVYPVSATEAFIVETDTVNAATPYLLTGKIFLQSGYPYNSTNALNGTSVGGLKGQIQSGGGTTIVPDVAVVSMAINGASFTMSVIENQAGTLQTYGSPFTGNLANTDQYGRVYTDLLLPFAPIFYVINQTQPNIQAIMLATIPNNPMFGYFEPQSMGDGTTFTAETIAGTFEDGTSQPTTPAVQDFSGVITLDGTSVVSGTEDQSTSAGNTLGENVMGSYSNIDPIVGSGTFTLTSPATFTGAFLIVSPTKIIMITTTASPLDVDPVLIVLGN